MKLRVLRTNDVERIVRSEFANRLPGALHAYLTTFNMICRKHRIAIVQCDVESYHAFLQLEQLELELENA